MKIGHDQLQAKLKQADLKNANSQPGLAPAWLVAGDEILLTQEAGDAIKAAAQAAGFSERVQFSAGSDFDWGQFRHACQSASLFSDKQLIVLHLESGKLNEAGKSALSAYLERPSADKLLLIHTGKLDAAWQKHAWYKHIEKTGVVVVVYPLQTQQLAAWITQRLQKNGLHASAEAIQLLAVATEGNLLATAREIDKLALLYADSPGSLTVEQIRVAIADSARYDVFKLADAMLQADQPSIVRILSGLQGEGTEPVLILWALTKEIRQLMQLQFAVSRGKSLAQALTEQGVWEKKKPWVTQTLRRHTQSALYAAHQQAARIDQVIKGALMGNIWDELMQLCLRVASR